MDTDVLAVISGLDEDAVLDISARRIGLEQGYMR